MQTFWKHWSNCITVSIKFRKTLQERRLLTLTFSQDNPQTFFLNFLTSENIYITLQYSRDILGKFLKQTFVECFLNILETLLSYCWNLPKDQHLLLPNHTFLTQKQLLHWELFKKSSPLKCSVNVPWRSRILQRWGNTHQIFSEHCVLAGSILVLTLFRMGGGKKARPYQFSPCNFYKSSNYPPKLSDFYF